MEFQRVNQTDPERIFVVAQNSWSTASLTNGMWCAWDIITDKNGVGVTKPIGINRSTIAGVAVETIPSGSYGLIQVWGYKSDCNGKGGSGLNTSKLTEGCALQFATSAFAAQLYPALVSAVVKSTRGRFPCGICIEPLNTASEDTTFTTATYEVLIRCL